MSNLHVPIGRIGKAGRAQSPFTPLNMPNLALWLDASDVTTISKSGNVVSQWNNKSKNGNNATQPTTSYQPIFSENKINNKPCLMPNANKNSYMTIPDFSFSAITAFAVLRNERAYPCIDNVAVDTSVIFSFNANESASSNNLRLLGQPGALWAHSGPVGEIIIFDRVLSALEHNRIGRYLGRKWGIGWVDIE